MYSIFSIFRCTVQFFSDVVLVDGVLKVLSKREREKKLNIVMISKIQIQYSPPNYVIVSFNYPAAYKAIVWISAHKAKCEGFSAISRDKPGGFYLMLKSKRG